MKEYIKKPIPISEQEQKTYEYPKKRKKKSDFLHYELITKMKISSGQHSGVKAWVEKSINFW